jgi:hypothetical protein
MDIEKNVKLSQTIKMNIKGDIKLMDLNSNQDFQEKLKHELDMRNLDIDPSNSSPTFSPNLDSYNTVSNVEDISFNVLPTLSIQNMAESAESLKSAGIINQQLINILDESVAKRIEKLQLEIKKISNKLDLITMESHSSKIVREIISELKLYYINQEFKDVDLNTSNQKYHENGKLNYEKLNNDYLHFSRILYEKYENYTGTQNLVHKLFTYKLDNLNSLLHPELSQLSINEIQEAIETYVGDEVENCKTNRIVLFFEAWKNLIRKI